MAKKSNTWVDANEVLAEVCENRHCQNGVGGEIKKMKPVGVHDVAEKIGKRWAEPAIEEHRKEMVPFWAPLRFGSLSGKHRRARMRPCLRRPEEVKFLPQRIRGELGEEKQSLLAQRLKPQRLGRFGARL